MAEEAKAPSCTLDFLGEMKRTHMCGEIRTSDDGKSAVLMGWVARRRDLGNLIFIDLRDRSGITQVVFDNQANPALHAKAETLRNEYVVAVSGPIKKRDADTINPNIETGEVELVAQELRILNVSAQPPFYPTDAVLPNEELRLKFRYIDLRRPELAKNIVMRHEISQAVRKYLTSQGFLEIETPFLGRSTPEGARDYLVPSRVHHGSFYALPQSPQLFKQILMISGMDKYFQLARCFRDEDLRADRQPEFTQIDLEMSFPKQETIFAYVEGFLREAFKVAGYEVTAPFPQITYDQAIRFYGSDKPDLRLPALTNVREAFSDEDMKELALDPTMPVVLIRIPKVGELSRKERDDIRPLFAIKSDGAKLFEDFGRLEKKFPAALGKVREIIKPEADELLVLVSGPQRVNGNVEESPSRRRQREYAVYNSAGNLRVVLAQKYAERHGLFKPGDFRFLWVTDFPMFEWDEEGKRWGAAHHAFTSPHEKDMDILESDPAAVRAQAYDVVLNGIELGSGSIRIHRQDIQQRIFRAMGITDEDALEKFGFFLEALRYGTPPHGGIALGLDRIVMLLTGAESLREVIPFPKTAKAIDVMSESPSPVTKAQLDELGIKLKD